MNNCLTTSSQSQVTARRKEINLVPHLWAEEGSLTTRNISFFHQQKCSSRTPLVSTFSIPAAKSRFINKHLVISKALEMAVGGNNRSLSDFLCHILTALPTPFSKNPKSMYIIPQCLFCISEENPRDNSSHWYFFLRVDSFSDQPWVTMMNGSQTPHPKI